MRSPDDFQSMDGFFFGFWTINTRWWMPLLWDPMFHALYISIRRHCFTLGVLILPWPGMIPSASFMWNKVDSFCLEVQLENHWCGSGKTMLHNLNPNEKHLVVVRYKLRDVGTQGNSYYCIYDYVIYWCIWLYYRWVHKIQKMTIFGKYPRGVPPFLVQMRWSNRWTRESNLGSQS